ncbi:MarR family winged helix-turn-helix transcriptional regulator [Vitiosangium sp. GDMCC 1.1324]|uniref:MarR family winged helix-turn-helix transcriptional regulator n=1 Tax=Vitiosangium sp. (strain GDMCC 1.1324) TaxID=2138576 RepID=UPI000D34FDF4|nr:MarR family winged helix-turn-helix transcriptional regulator [Vitiosangium sp. GDMCC 1.1324]PTL84948.1 MarR family transcriptional regulator [Vitiosangium sp. GDMCC 1.1324]
MSKLTPSALSFSELLIEVFHINGLALAAGEVLSNPSGLTSARWQVLGVVDHGPEPVASVARTMGLTRQSVQLTADSLERDGFIEYVDNPHHRRAKLIAITESGRRALREVEARHAAWATRLGKGIDLATLRATVEGLRRAREVLEQDAATPDPRKE